MKRIILKTAKREKNKKNGGGLFYTILFVTIVAVGTTAYVMHTKNMAVSELTKNAQQIAVGTPELKPIKIELPPDIAPAEIDEVVVAEEHWQSDDVLPVEEEIIYEEAEAVTAEPTQTTSISCPVDGEIIKPHSDTELVYSKTMEDWRLHKGIDIAVPIGTEVKASANGTVSECYTDTATGVTVIIDHGNGIMTRYSNLASSSTVKAGESVESGTVIGVVGDTAEFEIADEPHLHFEVIKDGKSVDPKSYFN
ncbi:MAG: M23 family metallopeptidase [Clostridia bacterium]|nr:M23 family metallopeptidase [Clostridia bacterium]